MNIFSRKTTATKSAGDLIVLDLLTKDTCEPCQELGIQIVIVPIMDAEYSKMLEVLAPQELAVHIFCIELHWHFTVKRGETSE